MAVELGEFSWDRMIEAVQAVRDRALRATAALEGAGFTRATVMDVVCFIDGAWASPRDPVRLLFAGETVRESHPLLTAESRPEPPTHSVAGSITTTPMRSAALRRLPSSVNSGSARLIAKSR